MDYDTIYSEKQILKSTFDRLDNYWVMITINLKTYFVLSEKLFASYVLSCILNV